ncbi:MAG: hypothetical protein ACOY9J_10850 [Pseudomonadota bacterium]
MNSRIDTMPATAGHNSRTLLARSALRRALSGLQHGHAPRARQ